jgi:FkbM family methyltransferase
MDLTSETSLRGWLQRTTSVRARWARVFARSWVEVRPLDAPFIQDAGGVSQLGQDILLSRLLPAGGRYVDIGAHDGRSFSNTWALEQRGWDGICVEPNPRAFKVLQSSRSAKCIEAAIGRHAGSGQFRQVTGYAEMLSGLEDEYDQRHRARIARYQETHGGDDRQIEVRVRRLDDILREVGWDSFDLLCVDVEGGELGVLDSADLSAFNVQLAVVENNNGHRRIERRMRRHGMRPWLRMGPDEFYVRSPFHL